jgi:tetrahydromethanopterin S-methyltransferase subunit H
MSTSTEPSAARGLVEFSSPQSTFEIGGVRVGGQPGVRPSVLIGTVFYHGHKVTVNADRGEFNESEAERVIRQQDEYAQKTGNPCMLDVVGATPEGMQRHLEFAARVSTAPLLIDGTTTEVRLAGLRYASDAGLIDRVVYNSIQPETSDEELRAVQDAGVRSAILLTYYLLDFTAAGRVQAVRELLPKCREAGIDQLMVDTCVLDLASFGSACGAIHAIKDEFGLPCGGGVHNAIAMWRGLQTKMGPHAYEPCIAAAIASTVAIGGDFVLYGPVEHAPTVFPAVAMMDTALSQLAIERGIRPVEGHPRFRVG